MDIKNQIRNLISKPALQPFWLRLLKLSHAGMNYGGGMEVRNSGELGALAFAARTFSPDQPIVLFDVGANQGEYFEAACSMLRREDLRIFAFDPQRSCFLALQARYKDDPRVQIRGVALGKERGVVDLFVAELPGALASLHSGKAPWVASSESVEMTTLDAVCHEAGLDHIDLLKIDTEGHEMDVLLGAQEMLASGRIAAIQFEFGETFLDTSYHFRDLYDLLAPRYTIHRILRSGLIEIPRYSIELEVFKITNFLCLRKNHQSHFVGSP
jgi:FkbM family methyltransferase